MVRLTGPRRVEVLDIPVSPARRAQLQRMDAPALEELLAQIHRERRWPARSKASPAEPSRPRSGSR